MNSGINADRFSMSIFSTSASIATLSLLAPFSQGATIHFKVSHPQSISFFKYRFLLISQSFTFLFDFIFKKMYFHELGRGRKLTEYRIFSFCITLFFCIYVRITANQAVHHRLYCNVSVYDVIVFDIVPVHIMHSIQCVWHQDVFLIAICSNAKLCKQTIKKLNRLFGNLPYFCTKSYLIFLRSTVFLLKDSCHLSEIYCISAQSPVLSV